MKPLQSINPVNQDVLETYEVMSQEDIFSIIEKSHENFLTYRQTSFFDRSQKMKRVAEILDNRKEELAKLMTHEMGKLLSESQSEIDKCIWCCNYYADNSHEFLKDEEIETDATKSYITYQPLGVILAIMPWNFPFWQVIRFAAPTLMAGNTALLKHSGVVTQCALAIQEIFETAGFPKYTFSTLVIQSSQVEQVIKHRHVKAITLTGSGPAGRAVAATAGSELKKTVLELGGSDPYIILPNSDIQYAAEKCAQGRLLNAGQSCIGAKRFIIHADVYEHFLQEFRENLEKSVFVDPLSGIDGLAPLAAMNYRDDLHEQVQRGISHGAHLLCGGYIPTDIVGAYYPPTILTEVTPENPIYREELFGPVALVFRVGSESEAIQIANDTPFGLGASVFTRNLDHGEEIAKTKLQAGACFVNEQVKSDPRLPFGGIGESGYGRELGYYGIREFVNTKTVYVAQKVAS